MTEEKKLNQSLRVLNLAVGFVAALISITACSETKIEVPKSNEAKDNIKAIEVAQVTKTTKAVELTAVIAEDTLAEIKGRDKIVIGVNTDHTPFGFLDSDGKNAGLEIDIARRVAEEILDSEKKVEFVPVTVFNRIKFLKEGKIDLVIATMTDTEKRRQEIEFSENYYSSGVGLLTKQDSEIKSWEDLKGKKVCSIENAFYNEKLAYMKIETVNFLRASEAYKSLKEGLCIGFAYGESGLVEQLQNPEWSQSWHQPLEPMLQKSWGIGVRQGDDKLLATVNDAIFKMEAEGFIVEGEKKWNIPSTTYAQDRMEEARGR
ncbi:MAG: transporter substrate-binding domain-containing protein [Symploca sp. SIO2E6]|nr:transporter substrate-binding domain-containing protein [Symploca sp. SIO2E6]